jgi:hypothetical protein
MKVCCVCSEFIAIEGEGDKGSICPECEVNYCFKCAATVNNCNICDSETTSYYPEFDPSLKLKKVPLVKTRKCLRKAYVSTIEYIAYNGSERLEHEMKVKALSKDLSEKGMCIFTEAEHKKGDRIKIMECSTYRNNHDAEVRWSHEADKGIYVVGLRFI